MLPQHLEKTRDFIYAALDFNPKATEYFLKHAEEFKPELSTLAIAQTSNNTELEGRAIRCLGYHLRERLRLQG